MQTPEGQFEHSELGITNQGTWSEIRELKSKDDLYRIKSRQQFKWFFAILLSFQNFAVYALVFIAFATGTLKELEIIVGVLITGTLAETYLIVRIMVEWVFSDINYGNYQ